MYHMLKDKLVMYLNGKTESERRLLILLACLMVLALLWLLIISPSVNYLQDLNRKNEKLAQLETQIIQITPLLITPKASTDRNIATIPIDEAVATTAKSYQIKIKESQLNKETIKLTIESVAYSDFNDWIAELQNRYQISATQFELNAVKNKPGFISISQLTLMRENTTSE